MLDSLDNGFLLLDNTDWCMDFYGTSTECDALCTAAEAIASPFMVNAIDAILYDQSPSKTIFWITQNAGESVKYACLVQIGRNRSDGIEGETQSVAGAITALNEWLTKHSEPMLTVKPA